MTHTKQQVLLVGATGNLGRLIAHELIGQGAQVRALVRPGKAGGLAAGVEAVEGDLLNPDDVSRAVEGVEVVVSSVGNSFEQTVTGQLNLVRASAAAGVRRFIPSDFSVDYRKLNKGDNANLDMRFPVLEALRASGMQPTSVLNGAFMEVLFADFFPAFDYGERIARIWGDGHQPMDLTTMEDTARYTARVAVDREFQEDALRVAGTVASMRELAALLGLKPVEMGSVDDLKSLIEEKKRVAQNPWEFIALQYLWAMVSGKGKLDELDNGRYPEIVPTGAAAFLEARR